MDNQVNKLLRIIKFSPPLIIIVACFFAIFAIYNEQKKELKEELELIENQFKIDEKRKIKLNVNNIHDFIKSEKENSEEKLKKNLKHRIQNAYDIAMNIYIKNKDKKSKEEIIKQIKDALEIIRFSNGRGYFSIHTMEGINILQPINRAFEGTNVLNRKDVNGKYSVREAINIAKTEGEGFITWYWYKPNDRSKEFKKTGIIKKFEPYNLIITTSEYVDDFEKDLMKNLLSQIKKLRYDGNKYIAIINYRGNFLFHPSSRIQGKNVFINEIFSPIKEHYKSLIEEKNKFEDNILIPITLQNAKVKNDSKFIYSLKFDDLGWILSSGFNLSEVNSIIKERKNILERKYDKYIADTIFYGIVFTIVLLILSFYISKLLEDKFLAYKRSLENKIKENKVQKETLQRAQKIAKIGEYELDLDTKIAHWSDSMVKIFGVEGSKETPGPKFLKKIMYDEDWGCFESSIKKCMDEKVEHLCRYRVKRPIDQRTAWIECRGQLTSENKLIGTIQDITQSKILEIEKQQKEDLLYQQSKMAAMGEMLGNIAHQWRQPLSAISTASTGSILQKEMNCLSDEEFYSTMEKINSSAQYLSQTIDDFRSFFNPKDNKEVEINISNTISKALNLVDAQFKAKDIQIIQNIKNCKVITLENELIQVLINILNNARDVLILKKDQKKVIIIDAYKKDNILYIEILDNAGGIKEDIINRVFEPYFTTKHKSVGTGIGLYMSEEITKKHLNGKISVSNHNFLFENITYTGAKFIIEVSSK